MTQDEVRKQFDYNPLTGDLIRKNYGKKVTGTMDYSGYKRTKFKGKATLCHRLIYIWYHGSIPEHYHIDHIDHDRSNNRIENLQALPPYDNFIKKKNGKYNNFSVYKAKKGWVAKVSIYTGPFNTEEEAVQSAIMCHNVGCKRYY